MWNIPDVSPEDLMEMLSDEYSRKILYSTVSEAKSAAEIAEENEIPLSTCYRRIRWLLDSHLLRVEKIILTDKGKKSALYRSRIKDIRVAFKGGRLSIEPTAP